jgi:hypothetical protein
MNDRMIEEPVTRQRSEPRKGNVSRIPSDHPPTPRTCSVVLRSLVISWGDHRCDHRFDHRSDRRLCGTKKETLLFGSGYPRRSRGTERTHRAQECVVCTRVWDSKRRGYPPSHLRLWASHHGRLMGRPPIRLPIRPGVLGQKKVKLPNRWCVSQAPRANSPRRTGHVFMVRIGPPTQTAAPSKSTRRDAPIRLGSGVSRQLSALGALC